MGLLMHSRIHMVTRQTWFSVNLMKWKILNLYGKIFQMIGMKLQGINGPHARRMLTTISSGSSSNIVRSANSESSTDNVPSSAKFGLLAVGGFLAMALALLFRSHQRASQTKDYEEVRAEVELSEVRFEKEIV